MPPRTHVGKLAERAWEPILTAHYKYVFKHVPIQGYGPAPKYSMLGVPYKGPPLTRGGAKPIADYVVGDSLDDLFVIDSKLSPNAGFTKAQRIGYPRIVQHGGEIITDELVNLKTGKTISHTSGIKLRKGDIVILHGADVESLRTGQVTLDTLVNLRKGQLRPDALPDPPVQPPRVSPESRLVSSNGTSQSSRSTQHKLTSSTGTGFEAAPKIRTGAGSLLEDIPDVRTRAGRLAQRAERLGKFRLGFGADLVIQIATQLMLGLLESKLAQANEEQIQRAYKANIYNPALKPDIDETIKQVQEGIFSAAAEKIEPGLSKKWLYLKYQYDVLMERQAKDISDAIIAIIRGFDFVEVYYGMQLVEKPITNRWPVPKKHTISMKRTKISEDVFRYRYTHWLLVWDPEAAFVFDKLRKAKSQIQSLLDVTFTKVQNRDDSNRWAIHYYSELDMLIDQFQFDRAYYLLVDGSLEHRDLPKIPDKYMGEFCEFRKALLRANALLLVPKLWPEDRRSALSLYLGTDVFKEMESLARTRAERQKQIQRAIEAYKRDFSRGRLESSYSSDIVDPDTGRTLQRRYK